MQAYRKDTLVFGRDAVHFWSISTGGIGQAPDASSAGREIKGARSCCRWQGNQSEEWSIRPRSRLSRPRITRCRPDSRPVFPFARKQVAEQALPVRRLRSLRKEDARWERIFQEKFADPEYSSRRSIRFESPLNEW
jgi:hypothetical protein